MKLVLFGATGQIGSRVLAEALDRGHAVTAVVRDPSRLSTTHEHLDVVTGDATDPATWRDVVADADVLVASLSPRRDTPVDAMPRIAQGFLDALDGRDGPRLVWVGGAGSLEVAPGVRLMDTDTFPAEWLPEVRAMAATLDVLRAAPDGIGWTFISPAAWIEPGERTGHYRTGGDQLLVDAAGESRISMEDYAVALLDVAEQDSAPRRRITVAY